MRARQVWLALALGVLSGLPTATAWAEDGDEATEASPPSAEDPSPAPTPPAPPTTAPLETLPPVDVVAPRPFGGPGAPTEARTETALRREADVFDVPESVSVLEQDEIRQRRPARSLSGALQGQPGILVQKTGPLQHSPFIRGFTGYQNLLLVDGIRLNHAAMRSGPNQYWATVDPLSIARLEAVRGPHSVLHGSDAAGGTVNAIPWRRTSFRRGLHWGGGVYTRYASAENSAFVRTEIEGNRDNLGWAGGFGTKRYGDLRDGGGRLPGTGDIDEWNADLRFDHRLARHWTLTAAWQQVRQYDAPRTERTIFSESFAGTSVGSELKRDFDQERDLVYTRLAFDGGDCCRPFSRAALTLHWHRHQQERDRERTGDRRDLQGFHLNQLGAALQFESPTSWGRFTYGVDYTRDTVDSFRRNFLAGVNTGPVIQGPLGDEGTYDLLGAYVQDEIEWGRFTFLGGVRFTYASAEADRVDNPAVAGSDPTTPGNIIRVANEWTNVVGSLRALYRVNSHWNLFAGASQAFRAPTLYDLTSLDSTSVVETPSPDLEPEKYLSFELGAKTQHRRWRGSIAGWYTVIDDAIIRSPTGALINGVPEVRKDNIGDGWALGIEVDGLYQINPCWSVFGTLSWMDSEVDQLDTSGATVRRPLSRTKPFTSLLGVRWEPPGSRFWAQAEWEHSEKADKLSLRDESDSRRIPPGGTPGFDIFHLRLGMQLNRRTHLSLSLENLTDQTYRIHGSGQNEPGLNAVFALDVDF